MISTDLVTIIYLGSNILYMYAIYHFIDCFLVSKRVPRFVLFFCYAAYYFITSVAFLTQHNLVLNVVINLTSCFLIGLLYYTSTAARLINAVLIYALIILSEDGTAAIISFVYDVPLKESVETPFYGVLGMIISKLVLLMAVQIAGRIMGKYRHTDDKTMVSYWLAIFLVPLGSAYILHTIFVNLLNNPEQSPISNVIAIVVLLIINSLIFYLYQRILEAEHIRHEQDVTIRKIKQDIAQISLMRKFQEEIRTLKHDLQNHHAVILALTEQGDMKGIQNYILRLDGSLQTSKSIVNSGNTVIDGIINKGLYLAEQEQITCKTSITVQEVMGVEDTDITSILGNLIDNAIEACKQVPVKDRCISIRIEYSKSTLLIFVSNPYVRASLQTKDGKLITTKKLTGNHGFGLRSIDRTVKKYKGLFEYSYDEKIDENLNLFKASALIYI